MYEDRDQFFSDIKDQDPDSLLEKWFSDGPLPHAFDTRSSLQCFIDQIDSDWVDTEHVWLGGTSAWRYSLNPRNSFSEFSDSSDIDVVNISNAHFVETWDRIRDYHRINWYSVDSAAQKRLRRNGENIYSGFVSPRWIPDKSDELRFFFVTRLETYSTSDIEFRDVNMYFFRNFDEVKDYYRRGIQLAKRRICHGI